jgi:MFS family permease
LAWFYVENPGAAALSSIIAFGVLRIKGGTFENQSWRWLFLIEGLITLMVGLVSFQRMPVSAVQTKRFLSPNGWYSDREDGSFEMTHLKETCIIVKHCHSN